MVWPLLENQQSSKHLNIELPHDLAILFLGTYPREKKIYIHSKACTQIFIAALFIIDKNVEKTKMSIIENYNGILFRHKNVLRHKKMDWYKKVKIHAIIWITQKLC